MAENLLEQLNVKIQKGETVTAYQVSDAYAQTIEGRRKEYIAKGGKPENFEQEEKAFIDDTRKLRDKQLNDIGELNQKLERKRLAVADFTKNAERVQKFNNAEINSLNMTDPDKKYGGWLDDYEGTGEDDKWGFGRTTLSGYLAGLQMTNPGEVNRTMEEAKKLFKDHGWDDYLSDDDVRKLVGEQNLKDLDGHNLENRPKAFLAAYLKAADSYFKNAEERKSYKDYVTGQIDDRLKTVQHTPKMEGHYGSSILKGMAIGNIAFPVFGTVPGAAIGAAIEAVSSETERVTSKNERAELQLLALAGILTPAEWKQAWTERLQKTLDPFKKICDTILSANPEFKFQDPSITEMLGKSLNQLTYLDEEKLLGAKEKARQEVFRYMQKKRDGFFGDIETSKKTLNDLKKRNGALKTPAVTDEEWTAFEENLRQRALDVDAAGFVENSSLEDLTKMWDKLVMVRDSTGLLKTKLDELETKTKDAETKEPLILKFTGEKNLIEKYDPKTKRYSYELGESGFAIEKGKLVPSFKNPDVKKSFEGKVMPYINALLNPRRLTPDEKKKFDELAKKATAVKDDKEKFAAAIAEASNYYLSCFEKKLTSNDLLKLQLIERMLEQGMKESTFSFDHRPTLQELNDTYNSKFLPAWEKAGKDFDEQIKPLNPPPPEPKPSSTVGGGFLGGGGPEKITGAEQDPYLAAWESGTKIQMPEGYRGYTGGLFVSAEKGVNLRDINTHKPLMNLPQQTGSGTNDITFAEPEGEAYKVRELTFVKVNYQGKVYYAALERMGINEPGLRKAPGTSKPEIAKETDPLAFLGKVNSEYRDALERILRDSEKPGGALFDLSFNKQVLPCRLTKTPQGYLINWQGGGLTYPGLREAMLAINSGFLLRQITYGALLSKDYYKPYNALIDDFNEDVRATGRPDEVYFELDWKGGGRGEGNAQIWAMATPYGGIAYRIHRDHVGLNGENDIDGFAANFDDFMKQIGHIKNWSEPYEKNRDNKKLTQAVMAREWYYKQISDPRNYYQFENAIGRPVSFDIFDNEVVQLYLDWGGGTSKDIMKNAMLNVWADASGQLNYILNFKGKNISLQGRARGFQEVITAVAQAKQRAGVATTVENAYNWAGARMTKTQVETGKGASEKLAAAPSENVDAFMKEKKMMVLSDGTSSFYLIIDIMNNPETASFMRKFNAYLQRVKDSLSPEDRTAIDSIIKNNRAKGYRFENVDQIASRLPAQYAGNFRKMFSILVTTYTESKLEFPYKPSLDQLRTTYDYQITPKWKAAEAQLDALTA